MNIFAKVKSMMTTEKVQREPTTFELLTAEKEAAETRSNEVADLIRATEDAIRRGTATDTEIAELPGLKERARVHQRALGEILRQWKEAKRAGDQEVRRANLESALAAYDAAVPEFQEVLNSLISAATAYANKADVTVYRIEIRALERVADSIADRDGRVEAERARQAALYMGRPTEYVAAPLP